MQAISNNIIITISNHLMESEFFSGFKSFSSIFQTSDSVEILKFHEEFLMLNEPINVLIDKSYTLNIHQIVKLFEAIDYFGALFATEYMQKTLLYILTRMNISTLLQCHTLLFNSPADEMMMHIYYYAIELQFAGVLSFAEFNNVYRIITTTLDVKLSSIWFAYATSKANSMAIHSIEQDIREFIRRSDSPPHIIVDWKHLYTSGLSEDFITDHLPYHRIQQSFLRNSPQYIIDITYIDISALSLSDLPIRDRTIAFVNRHFNSYQWDNAVFPDQWANNQWNDEGIDYDNLPNVEQVQFESHTTIAEFLWIRRFTLHQAEFDA